MIKYINEIHSSEFFDKELILAEIPKSETAKYVVTIGIRDAQKMVTMREFYLKDGVWKPTNTGFSLKMDYAVDLSTCMEEAIRKLQILEV